MASKTHKVQAIVDGEPTFAVPMNLILAELEMGGALKILSPLEYLTDRQRRWWKGVLLPALAQDTGESVGMWEARLKMEVMPDKFPPIYITVENRPIATVASITTLGKRKMGELIEGSVAKLHEWGFTWVTLPDSELRAGA